MVFIFNYLEEFITLSKRRNDEGRSYTFGRDLVNGPKLSTQ